MNITNSNNEQNALHPSTDTTEDQSADKPVEEQNSSQTPTRPWNKDQIVSGKEDTQDTSKPENQVASIFSRIIYNIQVIDFTKFASRKKKEEINSASQNNVESDKEQVTSKDASSSNTEKSVTTPSEKAYKIIFIDELLSKSAELGYPLSDFKGETRVYTGTHWLKANSEQIQHLIKRASQKMGVPPLIAKDVDFITKCSKQFQVSAYQETNEAEGILLNFLNGTLLILNDGTISMKESDPSDHLCYVLPYEYDERAQRPIFNKYLERVLPNEDKQQVMAEFIASCFTDHKHEKVLILYGDGANGKSVFLEVITALLGDENVSSHTLEALTEANGYYRAQIGDKLLNYSGEISTSLRADEFKKLASREKITARHPYGRPFEITNYARLAFNCNELPVAEDTSEGFYRRFLIVHFEQFIRQEDRDIHLSDKISSQELPGIMNWVLKGLDRLIEQNEFSPCESADRMLQQYKRQTDSVITFIESDVFKDMEDSNRATELFDQYVDYCAINELNDVGEKTFYQRIQKCGLKRKRKADGVYYQKPEM